MAAMRLLPWLVAAALMCACPAAHALDAGSMSADELAKVLAGVTFIKEMGNVANAKHAMNLFSKVADVHIGEVAAKGPSLQITAGPQTDTNPQNANPSIFNHGDPKFEYFLDPTQNPAADFFGFLNQSNTYVGTSAGPNFITYAPCFVAVAPSGVNIAATAINFIPGLLSITPSGVGIAPQGVNIQPSIIYISPYGLNVAPQGFNIQPQLIAVTPVEYSYIPQGYNYAPALISIAGRKMLQLDGAAAGRKLMGGAAIAAGAQKHPLLSADDQAKVFTESYGNWVDTVSALILGRSGGSAEQSKSFLSQTMGRTDHYLSLLNNDMLGSLSKFLPQPPQFDTPAFFQDASANISSTTNGFVLFSSFLLYAPCAVQIAPAGVAISPSGININPVGIAVTPQGINIQPQGLNIQPTLIFIAPIKDSYSPQGGNISPTLIAISPVAETYNPQGYSCAATGISVDEDGKVEFGDSGGCDGEDGSGTTDFEGGTGTAAATGR